jgi:hypothetical protein
MPFLPDSSEDRCGTNGVMLVLLPCSVCNGGIIGCRLDCLNGTCAEGDGCSDGAVVDGFGAALTVIET